MAQCEWNVRGTRCQHEAEKDERLCIFHLPIASPSKPDLRFWRHFANFYMAQLSKDTQALHEATNLWAFALRDEDLIRQYSDHCIDQGKFNYRGFIFPLMDDHYNLSRFVFAASDFGRATFGRRTPAADAKDGYRHPKPAQSADGAPVETEPPDDTDNDEPTPGAEFSLSRFLGGVSFEDSEFNVSASFSSVRFASDVSFNNSRCYDDVDFSDAAFLGAATLRFEIMEGESDFSGASFRGLADLSDNEFGGQTSFAGVRFLSEADFTSVHFRAGADFTRAEINGPIDLSRAVLGSQVLFSRVTLRDRMTCERLTFDKGGTLRLWGLNFARGRSHINLDIARTHGQVNESNGEVHFRDMPSGMERVSFLRTEVYSDRPYIKFSNVQWLEARKPRNFLYDAGFVYTASKAWASKGLVRQAATLSDLFNQPVGAPELEDAVRADVERIVREVRWFYENLAGYSDAGDFHIVEMAYRQKRTEKRIYKCGLFAYWLISEYGESPSRALKWLLSTWFFAALVYMYSGFCFPVRPVHYLFAWDTANWRPYIGDFFFRAVPFAFVNLFASYFRNVAQSSAQPMSTYGLTVGISVLETTLGIIALTLFLIAVRRRFHR